MLKMKLIVLLIGMIVLTGCSNVSEKRESDIKKSSKEDTTYDAEINKETEEPVSIEIEDSLKDKLKNDSDGSKESSSKEDANPTNSSKEHTTQMVQEKKANYKDPVKQEDRVSHVHEWKANTKSIHHQEEGHYEKVCIQEAWVEEKPIYETIAIEVCGNCGADCTSDPVAHIKNHMLNGTGAYGHRTEYVDKLIRVDRVQHEAMYEERWVIDQPAWDEIIVTYHCSCGATK